VNNKINFLNEKKSLVVLEVANNHQGDVEHALKLIDEYHKIIKNYSKNFNFAFKFQFRDLKTFIHKNFLDSDIKYVRRFLDTELQNSDWQQIIDSVNNYGYINMCTPFDEVSVDNIVDSNFDILKIASASLDDWPLIEKIGNINTDIEIIASVGGSDFEKIKRFYSFMKNKNKKFAINYCVSLYPTSLNNMNLGYIRFLKSQFPEIKIGFSTHESGSIFDTAPLAMAAGAEIFEKHIALEESIKGYSINEYSTNPKQLDSWLKNLEESLLILGTNDDRDKIVKLEEEALRDLKRGVFLKNNTESSTELSSSNVYFSIPSKPGQLLANDLSKFNSIILDKELKKDNPIFMKDIKIENNRNLIEKIRDEIQIMVKENNLSIPRNLDLEISHHYGIENFYKYGTSMVTFVNEDYCKKMIFQFKNQLNPSHYHKEKEETFIILFGELSVTVDDINYELQKGDMLKVVPGQIHSFSSKSFAIFEEISTTHKSDDSFYIEDKIMQNKNRKSKIMLF
tara:strand:- start:1397 stop:2926 length:1530 start_codon:yes stop_codon:yes gene_type:complete